MTLRPETRTHLVEIPVATPQAAAAHYAALLSLETDCWDVHAAMVGGSADFVLLDVRRPEAHRAGHVAGAVSLPRAEIDEHALAGYDQATVFVVYCNGPHCNGADRAALRLASLGRPVRKMIGGIEGWKDEGFDLVPG